MQRAGSSDSPFPHPTSQVLLTQWTKVVQSSNSSLNSAATQEEPPLLVLRATPSMILVSGKTEVLHGFHLMPFGPVKTSEAPPVLRQLQARHPLNTDVFIGKTYSQARRGRALAEWVAQPLSLAMFKKQGKAGGGRGVTIGSTSSSPQGGVCAQQVISFLVQCQSILATPLQSRYHSDPRFSDEETSPVW